MKLKNLVIALLLNFLALPGAGHWYLKQRKRALVFILPLVTGLIFFFYDLFMALDGVLHTAHMKDNMAKALALTKDIMPNQEIYLVGLFFIMLLSSLDIIWIFLSQVDAQEN